MAIITCRECNQNYSDKAAACPHCGCPTDHNLIDEQCCQAPEKKGHKKIWLIACIVLICVVGAYFGIQYYQEKLEAEKRIVEQVYKAVAYDISIDYLFQQSIDEDTISGAFDKFENPTSRQIFGYQAFQEMFKLEFLKAENELKVKIISELNSALNLTEDKEVISLIESYQKAIANQYDSNKKSLADHEANFWKYVNAADAGNYDGAYQLKFIDNKLLYGEKDLENYTARHKLQGYIDKHLAGIEEKTISDIILASKDDIGKKMKVNDTVEFNAKKAELIGSLKGHHININQELSAAE